MEIPKGQFSENEPETQPKSIQITQRRFLERAPSRAGGGAECGRWHVQRFPEMVLTPSKVFRMMRACLEGQRLLRSSCEGLITPATDPPVVRPINPKGRTGVSYTKHNFSERSFCGCPGPAIQGSVLFGASPAKAPPGLCRLSTGASSRSSSAPAAWVPRRPLGRERISACPAAFSWEGPP